MTDAPAPVAAATPLTHSAAQAVLAQWGQQWRSTEPVAQVEVLAQIDSTNAELMRRARMGQTHPSVLLALHQTAGRGRMGRAWHAQPGDALLMSMGCLLSPQDWSGLSVAVGCALVASLDPQQTLGLRLKWPNDVWVSSPQGDQKLAGVLIETVDAVPATAPNKARYCVVGVGINVRRPAEPDLRMPAVGWADLPSDRSPQRLLAHWLPALWACLKDFEQRGFAPFAQRFVSCDALYQRDVLLSDGRSGQAMGVDSQGALQVRTPRGLVLVNSAEVSVRPMHAGA